MFDGPSAGVLRAFGAGGSRPVRLGDRTFRAGGLFLKACDDTAEAAWGAELFAEIAQVGFRVPQPVRSRDGRWVVDGWTAGEWINALEPPPSSRWVETFAVSSAFHAAVMDVPRPSFIDERSDPWSRADRVAWGEADVPACGEPMRSALRRLTEMRRPIGMPAQVVHGDLTGNVLFAADGRPPFVIDLAAYHRPAAWADAIVVADAMAWESADGTVLELVDAGEPFGQLLVRALLFRMCTVAIVHPTVTRRLAAEIEAHRVAMAVTERLLR